MSEPIRQASPGQLRAMVRTSWASKGGRPPVTCNAAFLAGLDVTRNVDVLAERVEETWTIITVRAHLVAAGQQTLDLAVRSSDAKGLLRRMPAPRRFEDLSDLAVLSDEGVWPQWPRLWLLRYRPYEEQFQQGYIRLVRSKAKKKGEGDPRQHKPYRVYQGHRGGKRESIDYDTPAEVHAGRWRVPRSWTPAEYERIRVAVQDSGDGRVPVAERRRP